MPPKGTEQELGRALVDMARRQADARIGRGVKTVELGRVVSRSPIQVAPFSGAVNNLVLDADDLAILPGLPLEKGQTVVLVRTITDEVVAMPLISAIDYAEAPQFSGTDGPAGTDPNNTTAQGDATVSGPAGERVIAKALSYVGTKESPDGSNRGTKIDEWSQRWGLLGVAWCGTFVDAMYYEANVDDEGIGDPYTGNITSRAKSLGRHRTSNPVKGCFAVKGTQHVTLYISGPMEAAKCVGGNQSNGVTVVTYDIRGWDLCVPQAITRNASSTASSNTSGGSTGSASPRTSTQRASDWL